ncbi:MAG: hypothetical protein HXY28_04845, partial [Hydrogenophilaceae bacterium]|nr:hypothetical protein [Hydrogenophilaceae bacterium]
ITGIANNASHFPPRAKRLEVLADPHREVRQLARQCPSEGLRIGRGGVMVASFAAIAACLFALGVYVIVRQGVLFAPGAASAEQGDAPSR